MQLILRNKQKLRPGPERSFFTLFLFVLFQVYFVAEVNG
jgi:hypothetical protein